MIEIKAWSAMTYKWRLLRDRYRAWYWLERDGCLVAEGGDRAALLSQGWYF